MRITLAALAALALAGPALAAEHCANDAKAKAAALLKLHAETTAAQPGTIDEVKRLGEIKALKGKGRFDVLETTGYVYKAEYRIRLIYAQIKGSCILMGQEILENANPY